MRYIETLLFYAFSCSAVLVYGLGMEKTLFESRPGSRFMLRIPGIVLDTGLSVIALWFLVTGILLPYNVSFLVPMAILLVCGIVHTLVTVFLPDARSPASGERLFFFGTVFLAISEAVSFTDALVIVAASIIAFCITTMVMLAVRERVATSRIQADWKGTPLVLVSMGLLCIALYACDASWWFTEVFR